MRVLKFGGSSVADGGRLRAAAAIVAAHRVHGRVVGVVSALAGVTDALLHAARQIQMGDPAWEATLAEVAERHQAAYRALAGSVPDGFARQWAALLAEAAALPQRDPVTEMARLEAARFSGWGERLSVPLLALALTITGTAAEGCTAEPVLLANRDPFVLAEPSVLATRAILVPRLMPLLLRGGVPVLPGYIARDAVGRATTLGRNGSDYSAAIIAAALGAEALYIYSDVPGIFTADPHRFPAATLLPTLTYADVRAIAATGARVVHPRTVEPLAAWHIPLHLRSSFAPDAPGTDVVPDRAPAAVSA
jgi:aspartate kinase